MPNFRNRSDGMIISAHRWFKNGDHPNDCVFRPFLDTQRLPTELREGLVVRYFRHPEVNGESVCPDCHKTMHEHGWIDSYPAGSTVCPGDWIVTLLGGEDGCDVRYKPCSVKEFEERYELIP
jgi:hypothetical protein